jgi:DNA-binding CsgD family transcriptional regulator
MSSPATHPGIVSSENGRDIRRSGMMWRHAAPIPSETDQTLTPREREILRCFAEGLGTEAIAGRLLISRTTVRNHTQRILAKLRVHSRLAAVARGYATGVIAFPLPEQSAIEGR